MTLALFNAIEDIEVLIDCDNKPWFKRAHVGAFLGLEDIRTSVRNLEGDEFCTREQLGAGIIRRAISKVKITMFSYLSMVSCT